MPDNRSRAANLARYWRRLHAGERDLDVQPKVRKLRRGLGVQISVKVRRVKRREPVQ